MGLAKLEGDEIVIRIPKDAMRACFDFALDRAFGDHNYNISEEAVFIKEFIYELNREDDTGETVLHRALDAAIVTAVENGCETAVVETRLRSPRPHLIYLTQKARQSLFGWRALDVWGHHLIKSKKPPCGRTRPFNKRITA